MLQGSSEWLRRFFKSAGCCYAFQLDLLPSTAPRPFCHSRPHLPLTPTSALCTPVSASAGVQPRMTVDPAEAVALGAAIHAGVLLGEVRLLHLPRLVCKLRCTAECLACGKAAVFSLPLCCYPRLSCTVHPLTSDPHFWPALLCAAERRGVDGRQLQPGPARPGHRLLRMAALNPAADVLCCLLSLRMAANGRPCQLRRPSVASHGSACAGLPMHHLSFHSVGTTPAHHTEY